MTQNPPPEPSEFVSFDDLPKRVKQPPWRWWRQPLGVALICALVGAIALAYLANRPKTVAEQAVTLLAATNAPSDTVMLQYGNTPLTLGDLTLSRGLGDLRAGDRACLQTQRRSIDGTPRYKLAAIDQC